MNKNIIKTILGIALMVFGAVCILAVFLPWISISFWGQSADAGFFSASASGQTQSLTGEEGFPLAFPILLIAGGAISIISGALYGFARNIKASVTASIALVGGLVSIGTAIAFNIWLNSQLDSSLESSSEYGSFVSDMVSMLKEMMHPAVGFILTIIFGALGAVSSVAGIIIGVMDKGQAVAPVAAAPVATVAAPAAPAEIADTTAAPEVQPQVEPAAAEPVVQQPVHETAVAATGAQTGQQQKPGFFNWKTFGPVLGTSAIAALTWMFLNNRRKKRKRRLRKYAASIAASAARRTNKDVKQFDDMITAVTPEQYKKVNTGVRTSEPDPESKPATAYRPVRFSAPFSTPKNMASVQPFGEFEKTPFGLAARASAVQSTPGLPRENGIAYSDDARQSWLTRIAASMLPATESTSYAMDPSIGNMAWSIPAITGKWADNSRMTEDDRAWAAENGLDEAVIRSIVEEAGKFPAVKNLVSASVNGGFGDTARPGTFGIQGGLWDYGASAPTPLGTNMVYGATSAIGQGGAYRPMIDATSEVPAEQQEANIREKHNAEILRLLDEVGPSVFMPQTVLGSEMMFDPVGGIVPNLEKMNNEYFKPYTAADPNWFRKIDEARGWPRRDAADKLSLKIKGMFPWM